MKQYMCPRCGLELEPYLLSTTILITACPDQKEIPLMSEVELKGNYVCILDGVGYDGYPRPHTKEELICKFKKNKAIIVKGKIQQYHPAASDFRIMEKYK